MPIYVHLVKMTREGAGKIRNLTPEYAKVKAFQDSLGAKRLCTVACFGEYDFVDVLEYPNEAAALKAAGYSTSTGMVQVQTLPACRIEDFLKLMSELPT
jgi:uncharacterized protein with GYD domain